MIFRRMRRRWRADRRVQGIVWTATVATTVTGVVHISGWFNDPSDFWGAVFASWVAGVILFDSGGLAVAIFSLTQPETFHFAERVGILFQGDHGPHIDYAVKRLQALEHYDQSADHEYIIDEKRSDAAKFYIVMDSVSAVMPFIADRRSSYEYPLGWAAMPPPPDGGRPNKLAYVRVNGAQVHAPAPITQEGLSKILPITIEPAESAKIEVSMNSWCSDGGHVTYCPVRFTRKIRVVFKNRTDAPIWLQRHKPPGTVIQLTPGDPVAVYEGLEIEPGAQLYDFSVLSRPPVQ